MRYIELNETPSLGQNTQSIIARRFLIIAIMCDKCIARNGRSDQLCGMAVKMDFEKTSQPR